MHTDMCGNIKCANGDIQGIICIIEVNPMYQVYLAFGYHNIYDYTEEQFEGAKKFYKLFQLKENLWGNKRGDIFAWRKEK